MNRTVSVSLTLALLSGLPLAGCKDRHVAPPEPSGARVSRLIRLSPTAEAAAHLATVTVVEAPWSTSVSATGNLDYDASRVSPVSARVPGRVAEIRADLGRSVRRGEVLCLIDSSEAGEAQASFLKAVSEVNLKQKSFERAQMLLDSKAISQGEYLERQAAFEAARSEMALVENRLHLLGFDQEEVDRLRGAGEGEVRALFPVRAPISGRVVERKAFPGVVVDGTTELFKVADLSGLWLNLHIPEKELARVRKGQNAIMTVAAYPDERFAGVLDYLGDVVEIESRMVLARVILANPDWKLKPGMYAEAEVAVPSGRRAIGLPEAALQSMDGGTVAFVKSQDGAFEVRPVKTGEKSGEIVEILDGLKAGEEVVTAGSLTLKAEVLKSSFGEE